MIFRLRYLQHDFELSPGRFLIGRSTECQLSLDDPLVSRKHAMLVVADSVVEVRDLGSRNGVVVNGQRIERPTRLKDSDKILIGSQEIVVLSRTGSVRPSPAPPRLSTETMTSLPNVHADNTSPKMILENVPPPENAGSDSTATSNKDAFKLLGGVAEKSLALGRAEEAERLLNNLLERVLHAARTGSEFDASLLDEAGRYGAKLAAATGKASWANYVIQLHTFARRPCAAATIDELHAALRKVRTIDVTALRAYIALLREQASNYGPAERFLVQRIEGLERLVTAQ